MLFLGAAIMDPDIVDLLVKLTFSLDRWVFYRRSLSAYLPKLDSFINTEWKFYDSKINKKKCEKTETF